MNGTAHLTIGAATGFAVALSLQTNPTTTMILVGLGGVAGLVPDMDSNGKLSNKITLSHKFVRTLVQTIGILLILFSYFTQTDLVRWSGIGIGIALFFFIYLYQTKAYAYDHRYWNNSYRAIFYRKLDDFIRDLYGHCFFPSSS